MAKNSTADDDEEKDEKIDDSDSSSEDDSAEGQKESGKVSVNKLKKVKKLEKKIPFTDEEAENTICEFMETQNRPYSVQDLLNNFQH